MVKKKVGKMKILFFIESLHAGGKERRLVELIKGLSTDSTVTMHLVLTKENIHYKDILNTNIKIHYLLRDSKKDIFLFFKFLKIVKKIRPDIIHVWGNMVAIYAIPSSVFLRIPMINNQIADAPSHFTKRFLNHKLSFPFSHLIIANSYAGIRAYNAPKNKSKVVYNGFDFNRLKNLSSPEKIRAKFNINSEIVVGMVASFSDKKDYKSYIQAANIILKKDRRICFLCIGAGDSKESEQLVPTDNKNHVLFLGKQHNVESIMNVCDIGVLSTYTEGISNALLEFSALGKPVVTNYGGGNDELVADGITGYLVNQKSPDQLATRINELILDENKRRLFGARGKKSVQEMFSISKMIENFKNVYQEFIFDK